MYCVWFIVKITWCFAGLFLTIAFCLSIFLTPSFTFSFILLPSRTHGLLSSPHWLNDWLTHRLTHWLTDWLTDSLTHALMVSLLPRIARFPRCVIYRISSSRSRSPRHRLKFSTFKTVSSKALVICWCFRCFRHLYFSRLRILKSHSSVITSPWEWLIFCIKCQNMYPRLKRNK